MGLLIGRVVEQDLDAVGAGFLQAADRPHIEQIGQPTGGCGIVAGLLVGQQQASVVAVLRRFEPILGVEQDGRGMTRQHVRDQGLEIFEVLAGGGRSALLGERFLQRAALVHGGRGDDAARIGNSLQSCEFSGCQLRHA